MSQKDFDFEDPYKDIRDAIEEYKRQERENREEMPFRIQERGCLHKLCGECHGSGKNRFGGACLHMISCPCPSCSPTMQLNAQQNTQLLAVK